MKRIVFIVFCLLAVYGCSKDQTLGKVNIAVNSEEDYIDLRDGKLYKTIKIANQIWMAENLSYRFSQGSLEGCYTYGESQMRSIDLVVDKKSFKDSVNLAIANSEIVDPPGTAETSKPTIIISRFINLNTPRQLMVRLAGFTEVSRVMERIHNNLLVPAAIAQANINKVKADAENDGYSKKYGFLYTFEAAKKAAPTGWRLPTDQDWKKLEASLGMPASEVEVLDQWRGNGEGDFLKDNGSIGFKAMLGGTRAYGSFLTGTPYINKEVNGYFWSSSQIALNDSTKVAITRSLMKGRNGILRGTSKETAAYHIRCIKE